MTTALVERNTLQELEGVRRERRLSELEIIRDTLEEKNRQLWELRKRVEFLEEALDRIVSAQGGPTPALQRSAYGPIPRRWRP